MAVGQLAHDGDGYRVGQRVDGKNPNAQAVIDAQGVLDNGTRRVDNAHVQSAHAQTQQVHDCYQDISFALSARGITRGACSGCARSGGTRAPRALVFWILFEVLYFAFHHFGASFFPLVSFGSLLLLLFCWFGFCVRLAVQLFSLAFVAVRLALVFAPAPFREALSCFAFGVICYSLFPLIWAFCAMRARSEVAVLISSSENPSKNIASMSLSVSSMAFMICSV